jgi:hypothetical protein
MRRTDKIALAVLAAVMIGGLLSLVLESVWQQYLSPPLAPCPATRAGGGIPDGSRIAASADPFAGPGPHPLVLVTIEGGRQSEQLDRDRGTLPPGSLAAEGADGRPVRAQLVVCRYRLDDAPVRIAPCRYSDQDNRVTEVEVRAPWFEYQVRQAVTGALVTRFKESASDPHCSLRIAAERSALESEPNLYELAGRLKPVVAGPR